jgi:glycosyltransferase involved in cell wall biosynthesis
MKVAVVGTRGFPDVQGGVENHCEHLYPLLVEKGAEIIVFTRKPYIKDRRRKLWKGVKLQCLWCPNKKSIEAVFHTFLALLCARFKGVDIVHVHAIGPAIMTPFAKLLGLKVVMTHHGHDYRRDKWNYLAKAVLKLGEKAGCRCANEVISISKGISDFIKHKFNRNACLIYNGVNIPGRIDCTGYLDTLGLKQGKYVLAVARFVPEKGLHHLISAFSGIQTDWNLVIVGDAVHETDYSKRLKAQAANNSKIVLTGSIYGNALAEVYSNAGLFVLPSCHEGLPIVLLEALSYGLSVIVSNISPNIEIGLDKNRYFAVGNEKALAQKLDDWIKKGAMSKEERAKQIEMITQKYNWNNIAEQTLRVYKSVLVGKKMDLNSIGDIL